MTGSADDIEAISWQAHIKRFYKRASREFVSHEHIAKNANALSSDHCLDCMELLPEAKVVHVLKFWHIAPLASRNLESPLLGWSPEIGWRPIAVNEDLSAKVGSTLQARGK
jgi:hypothetical protein